ncbi:hypothetical protein HPP92_028978 [Vanilla planifolia]|uniref:Uncharacterized protein n=1 Tax=Vanilla planifolia TaxID=51239 RepID=A0A835P768_VANPL|nr:hypothetical protein HPP92_028978 [Vanilla planifolia]KAG0446178.1 hypothetical protein HPP92_028967 [Vanilla planifolia]
MRVRITRRWYSSASQRHRTYSEREESKERMVCVLKDQRSRGANGKSSSVVVLDDEVIVYPTSTRGTPEHPPIHAVRPPLSGREAVRGQRSGRRGAFRQLRSER